MRYDMRNHTRKTFFHFVEIGGLLEVETKLATENPAEGLRKYQ
jgi:hypothetical protein